MKLSIVIPCYNEKNTIDKIINAVRNSPVIDKEIIVVDDFSTDGTRELLNKYQDIKIAFHNKNMVHNKRYGSIDAWIRGSMHPKAWIRGFVDPWIQMRGSVDPWTQKPGFVDPWIPGAPKEVPKQAI